MNTQIYYVSAPAGSGKTHRLEQYAATMASSGKRKILIAQPTKELIQQTANRISNLYPGVAVHTIYSGPSGDSVLPRIERHMAHAERAKGQVLLITHEALKRLPPAHRIHWDLIVDEIPAVFGCIPLKIVDTHHYLTDHLALEDLAAGISAVKIADRHEIDVEALKRNDSDDELLEHYQSIATHLLDDNRTVMVETAAYLDLIEGRKTVGEVNFFSLLRSEFVADFESVTFMGANALETELFVLWGALDDVEFRQHPILSKGLRYSRHQNGDRLTIHYLFEQQWSISRSLKVGNEMGPTLLESVGHYIERFFSGQRFLWVANKSADMRMFNQNDRLPPVSHGLNKPHFMNCHAVASTIALVHDNASAKFLGMLGLTKQQIRTIICYQSEYQAIMRCSLRDPEVIAPVTIIVPSQDSAEWIASKFDGCLVSKLDTGLDWKARKVGRPKAVRAMSGAERARKCRERKKLKAA